MRSSIQSLAQSVHYQLSYEYETVWLTRDGGQRIVVGDFYGDPDVAIIDSNEKWCAMGGFGVIVYFLEEPFEEYEYNKQSPQYFELGRTPDNGWWVESIQQTGASEIQVILDTGVTLTVAFQRAATGCAFVIR